MKPYTYLLHHIPTNLYYYGAKWAKGCHPDTFWKDYFTSSDHVALLRTLYGDESFEFEIRRTFKDGKEAVKWESKVLNRMKVLENQDIWLNRTTHSAWLYDVHPMLGKKRPSHSKIMKERLSNTKNNPMYGKSAWNKGKVGFIRTVESREKQSTSMKLTGHIPPNRKGIPSLKKGKKYGYYWINNGIIEKMINCNISYGWVKGRKCR